MEEDHSHSGSGGTSEWFKEANRHVTLKFDDIVYKVKLPPPSKSSNWPAYKKSSAKSEEEKTILNGVSGTVYPGEMLAMLGPSGSGKTTLLTALGGKFGGGGNNGKLNGTVTYNGAPFSSQIRRTTGFVTQDDVLYPQLTVTETLVYTALLRLPNSLTRKEKVAHAEGRGSVMGGENLRGISGGERKRVSIGQVSVWNV